MEKIRGNKFLILFFILFTFTGTVFAEEVKSAKIEHVDLSFEQAYILMLENNYKLKAYNQAIQQSKYEKKSALGQFAPKVVANATYLQFSSDMTLSSAGSAMGVPFSANTLIQEKSVFGVGGMAVWNIFTGGKLLSNHAAARAKLEAANEKYKETKDSLTIELVKRYYGLRLARDVEKVRKQVEEGIGEHLRQAKLLEKEGMISKAERLHAQVAYSEALRDYKSAQSDVNIAEEGLKSLIKAENANLKNVSIEPVSLLFIYDNEINLNEIKQSMLTDNPQLKQLKAKKKAMNAKYHAKAAEYSPNISLVAYDIAGASHLSEAVPRAAFGATANWLLFDGFSRYNNVKAADAERKMVDFEIKDAENNLESLATKQYEEMIKNKTSYECSDSAIENAQEALKTANLAFKEGFGTSLQVTDAQMMLSKVKIERLNAIYNYDLSLVNLLKTSGNTNEFLKYLLSPKFESL